MSEPTLSLAGAVAVSSVEGDGPLALVVDDSESMLRICVRVLGGHGYRVESASDGASALRAMHRTTFDVLVSDIQMPGMSGLQLLEAMRAEGIDIPVVFMTGNPSLDSAIDALNQGVLRYLAKPLDPRALVAVVNEVVRLHGIARAERLALDNEALQSLVLELRRSKEAALAAAQAKSMFLSKMGHELRAPMSAVIGMTDLALGTALSPQGRAYLETVKTEAESLMETIAHVLDFSDLESARVQLVMSQFSVRDVVEDTLSLLRRRASAKGLSLISNVAAEIPNSLVGDSVRFGLIMKALVGNAVKFTQRGEVRVDVQLEACRGVEAIVGVAISDTGIGIQAGALKRVLEPFMQEDNSGKREYGGAGLGLTIASQLVALMKGTLDIESTPNVGTKLRFTVCLEQVPPADDFFMLDEYARRSGAL